MKNILVTGGAGFIGTNLVYDWWQRGNRVRLLDNLSREGVKQNLEWLQEKTHQERLEIIKGDVRDEKTVIEAIQGAEVIFHEAGQTAVTTSLINPSNDFEINARGTVNVLEAMRRTKSSAVMVYASTNKVYGNLADMTLREEASRYITQNEKAVTELRPLDFYSPYGCSKGSADQYVRDYSRTFGLKTVVFRQSCIYGEHQIGVEDQGWVAHFVAKAIKSEPITIYGDGKQVRDLLYIGDLLKAYRLAVSKIKVTNGQVYNIGGGIENAVSLIELIERLEKMMGKKIVLKWKKERVGDQKYYVSETTKAWEEFGWRPQTGVEVGLEKLVQWLDRE